MLTFLFKNLLIFTQNFSLSNVEKKIFLSSLFLKKIYQFFKIWKKFMHKNAIKIVGGVKFSKKIPQNVGFFDQKVWDFWHWGGDKIVGFSASRGGFSPFNFWPHWLVIFLGNFRPKIQLHILILKDLSNTQFGDGSSNNCRDGWISH